MALEQELIEIEENFEYAYYSREEDLESLRNLDRKILNMHLGGIVLECFVKYLIVNKYGMNKRRKSRIGEWYSEYTINLLRQKEQLLRQNGEQLKGKNYEEFSCNVGSKHNFIDWIKEILIFDTNNINEDLEIVYSPLGENCFIDLRYVSESSIEEEELNRLYIQWQNSYNNVMNWLNHQADNLQRADYYKNITE
ncbi:MAG: hypothetical protein ACRCXT_01995 [Paraclostridium sp.]